MVSGGPSFDRLPFAGFELVPPGCEDAVDLLRGDGRTVDDESDVVVRQEVDDDTNGLRDKVAVGRRIRLDRVGKIERVAGWDEEDGSADDGDERDGEQQVGDAVSGRGHGRDATADDDERRPDVRYRSGVHFNPILEQLGSYPIADIRARAAAREEQGLPVIDFSIGDPREPTPDFIAQALKDGVTEVSQYPTTAGKRELRQAIAGYVARRHGVMVDPETQIIPTSGSKEAIFNTAFAFIDKDARDLVVFPSPGYPVYERGALFAGAELYRVVLDGDFVLRASDIPREVWDRARLVWICTPHNPAGSVTTADELRDLVAACRANDALLLSDECYADTYEDEEYPEGPASVLQVAGDGLADVLVYLSLSKRSGMTGYRSGAIVGDPRAIAALKDLRSSTGTASADFVQAAAIAAWNDDGHAADRRAIFTAKRRILERAFLEVGMEIIASRAGLYLWVLVGDDLGVTNTLLEHGIVVSPGTSFGEGGEGYIRLALVPGLDECEAAADALREALA